MKERTLESLDLNLLLALHWLLTERNVTEAAARLDLSQPAMSRTLSRLRDVFNDPLLVKSGRTMLPTPKADKLQPAVAHAVERMRDILRISDTFDPGTYKGRVRIACKEYRNYLIASTWARSISAIAPGIELDISDLTFAAANDLVSGQIDLVFMPDIAFVDVPPGLDLDQFVQKPVFEEQYICAIRKDHPLAGKKMSLKQYIGLEHILVNPGGKDTGVMDQELARLGMSRRIKYRTYSFFTARYLVMDSDCVLTAPEGFISTFADEVYTFAPPTQVPKLTTFAGWHPNWTHDQRHKWVRETLFRELHLAMDKEPVRKSA
ncbi:MAG: LysR family transcriptional regulator [Aquisalinus sp.]|nr:LysR family transcriptional regulator [Aquisalinus sp.]